MSVWSPRTPETTSDDSIRAQLPVEQKPFYLTLFYIVNALVLSSTVPEASHPFLRLEAKVHLQQTWLKHGIVLDSSTFLCSVDLAWCN